MMLCTWRSISGRNLLEEPLRCSDKASADAFATLTLTSRGQVREGSPHVHRGYAQQCRAYLRETLASDEVKAFELVDHTEN